MRRVMVGIGFGLLVAGCFGTEPERANEAPAGVDKPAASGGIGGFGLLAQPQWPVGAARPRFSRGGDKLTFEAGEPGQRTIWVVTDGRPTPRKLGGLAGDNRDPTWDRAGQRVIYASNRDGNDYDLYAQALDSGKAKRLRDLPGDELQPSVHPLAFESVVVDETLDEQVWGTYRKVAFTRRRAGQNDAIWSMSTDKGDHLNRLSDPGRSCSAPFWSSDGRRMVYECRDAGGRVVMEGAMTWLHDSGDIRQFIETRGLRESGKGCQRYPVEDPKCVSKLPVAQPGLDSKRLSAPVDDLRQPTISANQIVVVAVGDDGPVWRPRTGNAGWRALELPGGASWPVWTPDGAGIAFTDTADATEPIGFEQTDFYLQDVVNLNDFPELLTRRSKRLAGNGFVARPGDRREFYLLYKRLRQRRRPQFVTADAVLELFRDEFLTTLEDAEEGAERNLEAMTRRLADAYWDRYRQTKDASARYLAVYFATAGVPLEAAKSLLSKDGRLKAPLLEQLPKAMAGALDEIPRQIRPDVRVRIDKMLGHGGVDEIDVPGLAEVSVDYSKFKVRGPYADNNRAGYFLAMTWYALVPLPFDKSLVDLQKRLETMHGGKTWKRWQAVSDLAGAFMGRPVDPTMSHLGKLADHNPDIWSSFETNKVAARLRQMVDTEVRGAQSASHGIGRRALKVVFFPKRSGVDTEIMSRLTKGNVSQRPMPSPLDPFAALGNDTARDYLAEQMTDKRYAKAYRKTLDALRGKYAGGSHRLWPTDLYHAWLSALVALAAPQDLPRESTLEFAKTDAWQDRKLYSALAGYIGAKHASGSYGVAGSGAGGAFSRRYLMKLERPVLPEPKGFVDPEPELFGRLAKLAQTTSRTIGAGAEPLDARSIALRLQSIARREVAGKSLTDENTSYIEQIGSLIEEATPQRYRSTYGVSVVADIHTAYSPVHGSGRVLQLGIGRLLDAYVAVPNDVGRRMTQGAFFCSYIFDQPIDDRLTDRQWYQRLRLGEAPPRPDWTNSFIQPRTHQQ